MSEIVDPAVHPVNPVGSKSARSIISIGLIQCLVGVHSPCKWGRAQDTDATPAAATPVHHHSQTKWRWPASPLCARPSAPRLALHPAAWRQGRCDGAEQREGSALSTTTRVQTRPARGGGARGLAAPTAGSPARARVQAGLGHQQGGTDPRLSLPCLCATPPLLQAPRGRVVVQAASRPLWLPGAKVPSHLNGT